MSDPVSEAANANLGIYGGFTDGTTNDGLDRFENLQQPNVTGVDDLSRFVIARIVEAELEPRSEVIRVYDQAPAGPMAHRYAKHVRRDCVVFRKQVAQYLVIKAEYEAATDEHERTVLSGCVLAAVGMMSAIAERWSDHPEFRVEWRVE